MDTNRRSFLQFGTTVVAGLTAATACSRPEQRESPVEGGAGPAGAAGTFRLRIDFAGLCAYIRVSQLANGAYAPHENGTAMNVALVNHKAAPDRVMVPVHVPELGVPSGAVAFATQPGTPKEGMDYWNLSGRKLVIVASHGTGLHVYRGRLHQNQNGCADLDPESKRWNGMAWVPRFSQLVANNALKAKLFTSISDDSLLVAWAELRDGVVEREDVARSGEAFSKHVLAFEPPPPAGAKGIGPMPLKERVHYTTEIDGDTELQLQNVSNTQDTIVIRLKTMGKREVRCIVQNWTEKRHTNPNEPFTHFALYYELLQTLPDVRPVPRIVHSEEGCTTGAGASNVTSSFRNDYSSTCTGTEWP